MAHIKNLFYTFIWNTCPELFENGHIYAGVPPLYKITMSNGYKYLKDDDALIKFRRENKGKKYSVNRLKGLGEMSVEETEETLTHSDKRIIKQITFDDAKTIANLFESLMGKDSEPRKDYIREHSKEATIEV